MMQIYEVEAAQSTLLRRAAWDALNIPESLLNRLATLFGERISPCLLYTSRCV